MTALKKTHEECGLQLACRQIASTDRGPIVEFVVAGKISLRNPEHEQARVLDEFVQKCLTGLSPVGLLFDMTEFRYRHGDSVFGSFVQIRADRSGMIPVAVVAKGRTKSGLTSLLDIGGGSMMAHLVTDRREEALEFLRTEAGRDGV